MYTDVAAFCVGPETSIREAIARIDANGKGVVLAVDEDRRLMGVVTDGDIRRAVLAGVDLSLTVQRLLADREPRPGAPAAPVTERAGTPGPELLRRMNELTLRHLPLVDDDGRVVDLALLGDLVKDYKLPVQAVVMAGGAGSRLRPLTESTPKPMLPVGDRPLLERTLEHLRDAGIRRVNIATHYKAEQITRHFGTGASFGVDVHYVAEDRPLGTAGALGLLEVPDEPFLVMNGDILTDVDFRAMLAYHQDHRADLTIGVRHYDVEVPYGVVDCTGYVVHALREKPHFGFFVNAGIYLLEPSVLRHIPNGKRYDMTDLIQHLLGHRGRIVSFPIVEYWLDIGQLQDYQQAQEDVEHGRIRK